MGRIVALRQTADEKRAYEFTKLCDELEISNGALADDLDYERPMYRLFKWANKYKSLTDNELRSLNSFRERLLEDIVDAVKHGDRNLGELTRYILDCNDFGNTRNYQSVLFRVDHEQLSPLKPFQEHIWEPILADEKYLEYAKLWLFQSCNDYRCIYYRTTLVLCIYEKHKPATDRAKTIRDAHTKMQKELTQMISPSKSQKFHVEQQLLFWLIFLVLCHEYLSQAITYSFLFEFHKRFADWQKKNDIIVPEFHKDFLKLVRTIVKPDDDPSWVFADCCNGCEPLESMEDDLRGAAQEAFNKPHIKRSKQETAARDYITKNKGYFVNVYKGVF